VASFRGRLKGHGYRYYASVPALHGEAETAPVGSISRVPATDVEHAVVKSLGEHLAEEPNMQTGGAIGVGDHASVEQLVAAITVHKDKLVIRLKSETQDEGANNSVDRSLTIPWQKPPSKRRRQILLPSNKSRSEVRPQHFERRARLVSSIARGRQWLDDVVSGRVQTVAELCAREKCSIRQVNMTISLAFLAPNLVNAAVEGRLPRGIGIERLRDLPAGWNQQFDILGLNPE
jgi:site-specific DNA recombinase